MTDNRHQRIELCLKQAFNPVNIEVVNESHQHNVPKGSESHFKVMVVCSEFEGKTLIARHRHINGLLAEEFDSGLHALAIHAYTLPEWQKKQQSPDSPKCKGGFGQ